MSLSVQLISDFNIEVLGRLLANSKEEPMVAVSTAPFNQVFQTLASAQPDLDCIGLLWTRPEGVLLSYAKALAFEGYDVDAVLAEVDAYADLILSYASRHRYVLVVQWIPTTGDRGQGMLDWRPGLGLRSLMARTQLRLAERLSKAANIYVVDPERWVSGHRSASAAKMWFATKMPFENAVFKKAVPDLKGVLQGLAGKSRRLIVLDLDDILWGGIVGEQGWKALRLGGHDFRGEAYVAFQQALKNLTRRGIQLAIVSKNTESVALEAIEDNSEMVLKKTDLAGWRINWTDKAQNIRELADDLNLGLASLVFIDDNPVERARVRDELPEVLVPEWPKDPTHYVSALHALSCFEKPSFNVEDGQRSATYVTERERRSSREGGQTLDDWLLTLQIEVELAALSAETMPRVAQLFNKTNQMNLSTRRMSQDELSAWAQGDGCWFIAVRVRDRYGDSGLTGLVSLELRGEDAHIQDLILSCRVMGRRIEEALIALAIEKAREQGAKRVIVTYHKTARNAPCLTVLRESQLQEEDEVFTWDCSEAYPRPTCTSVVSLG